jgi:hypothetical protein
MKKYVYVFTENILYGSTYVVFAKNGTKAAKRFVKNYYNDSTVDYYVDGAKLIVGDKEFFFSMTRISHKMIGLI